MGACRKGEESSLDGLCCSVEAWNFIVVPAKAGTHLSGDVVATQERCSCQIALSPISRKLEAFPNCRARESGDPTFSRHAFEVNALFVEAPRGSPLSRGRQQWGAFEFPPTSLRFRGDHKFGRETRESGAPRHNEGMMRGLFIFMTTFAALALAPPARADFAGCVNGLKLAAVRSGVNAAIVNRALALTAPDEKVLRLSTVQP